MGCDGIFNFNNQIVNNVKEININDLKISIQEEQLNKIEEQKKFFICKLNFNKEKEGIGFFCKIPFKDKHKHSEFDKVLICHNSLIDNYINKSLEIWISLNDNELNGKITIDDSRKLYINRKDELAIIEIKNSDNLDRVLFLEINEDLTEKDYIYCLHNLNNSDNNITYTFSKISLIKDKYTFQLTNDINAIGCPIINSSNNKVIGITRKNNQGIFIKKPIEEYILIKDYKINPYVKSVLLCFYRIYKIKNIFKNINNINKNKNKDNNYLTNLIFKLLKNYEEKINNLNQTKIIIDIEEKVKELNRNILNNMNFEELIEIILIILHEESNSEEINNLELPDEDYDERLAYKNFEKYYLNHNKSTIQESFFGVKEIITNYKCCGLKKYKFEEFKYIIFEEEKLKTEINLQNLLSEYENFSFQGEKFCKMCYITSEETLVQNKIYSSPEILIIIIRNKNKLKIDFDINLKTINYEYTLIACINETYEKSNIEFNVIYNNQNDLFNIIDNGNITSRKIEKSSLSFPRVFFYQKNNTLYN